MKKIITAFVIVFQYYFIQAQERTMERKSHFVCIQSSDVYHDKANCSSLQMCSGGKIRKTKNIQHLKPCMKCARPARTSNVTTGFSDIKRVLGVKDKKQIADSLGTSEGTIHDPQGFTARISGPPDSRTVNMIEFYFDKPVAFKEDTLFSPSFYKMLGLQFEGCKADTIRNNTPHPVTGKVKKDVSIEYRGCAIVERRDNYEDLSKYYYEVNFLAKEENFTAHLEKIQLILRVDRP